MYGDIHLVVVLVDYADNLLIAIARRNPYESSELTYSKVYMYDIVTRLHLLQLLHCKCHLTCPCRIAAKAVLMEAVENLMVGEETCTKGVVSKSLMKRMVHRLEAQPFRPCIGIYQPVVVVTAGSLWRQYLLQSLLLLAAVGKNIQGIAHLGILRERLPEHVEVFME